MIMMHILAAAMLANSSLRTVASSASRHGHCCITPRPPRCRPSSLLLFTDELQHHSCVWKLGIKAKTHTEISVLLFSCCVVVVGLFAIPWDWRTQSSWNFILFWTKKKDLSVYSVDLIIMFTLLLSLACAGAVAALPNRTWTTYVETRDGVKLHTRIFVPRKSWVTHDETS